MPRLIFISHPEVFVDPRCPITEWGLNEIGKERAARFAQAEHLGEVTSVWSSTELKARETAEYLAGARNLQVQIDPHLGENDRSSTGFLPPTEFEQAADAFFAAPQVSFEGWETAQDAQSRIEGTVRRIAGQHQGRDLAVVSHGAVGTLLFCALSSVAISRDHDQPGQGHYWSARLPDLAPLHAWRPI